MRRQYCVLPGRYQCIPPHDGHLGLAKLLLSEGESVCYALRETDVSPSNPYTFEERKAAIEACFPDEVASGQVIVVSMHCDIKAICYGRDVGWDIRRITLDAATEAIRATDMRRKCKSKNIGWELSEVTQASRDLATAGYGQVIWLTGLSASGKSTLARGVEAALIEAGILAAVLDGDNLRHGINDDLGFSPQDRDENIRRVGHIAAMMADAGIVAIAAFISPYELGRLRARGVCGKTFTEVYLSTPVDVCEERDPKGLYAKARKGEIKGFTGIDAPYETPSNPELIIDTSKLTVDQCVQTIMNHVNI